MKKTYIAPKFAVVELEAETLIATSFGTKGTANGSEEGFEKAEGESRSTLWGED